MPRVRTNAGQDFTSPVKKMQIPLNDDRHEKAQRLQSRQVLQSKHMDQLKAAASPQRKRKSLGDGPHTPSQDSEGYNVAGNAITPMKRVPLLANFEEWMKMATDNKINATNSWNFALIDYFHDMSLLREGNGVNFQKASCTLDASVKIYTSRVDSVATETGKLLSGLADSGSKKRRDAEGQQGDEGEDDDEEGEDGGKKKSKKRSQRSAEATLASSFDQLRLKKMELEFSVDPLFKQMSADFDEGGAKGLLMNHLSIDGNGRIVFDTSDDTQDASADDTRRDSMEPEHEDVGEKEITLEEPELKDGPIDMAGLAARFFPDLEKLDEQDICPSLKTFELGSGNGVLDLPFLKAPEEWRDERSQDGGAQQPDGDALPHDGGAFDMNDDDDDGPGGMDLPIETGFGEGGDAWAQSAALVPQMRVRDVLVDEGDEGGEVGTFDADSNTFGVTLQHRDHDQENILNYFDNALNKNWAGPEHWKIARIKEANKPAQPQRVRKEKEPFEIDFAAPMSQDLATMLYTTAKDNKSINLPKTQRRSKTRNLLPDDKHFNSKDLLKLFLKPKAKIGARKGGHTTRTVPADGEIDEAYWAANGGVDAHNAPHPMDDDAVAGGYDANFFGDDNPYTPGPDMNDDDDEFADAQEDLLGADAIDAGRIGPGIDGIMAGSPQEGAFGVNLITQSRRSRPEYVQYARVAKKVDVRRLKEEMWRGTGLDQSLQNQPSPTSNGMPGLAESEGDTLHFTSMMRNLQHVYPQKAMADISTSFGFICLLHLANEKGLIIENVDGWQDLTVRRDFTAQDLEVA